MYVVDESPGIVYDNSYQHVNTKSPHQYPTPIPDNKANVLVVDVRVVVASTGLSTVYDNSDQPVLRTLWLLLLIVYHLTWNKMKFFKNTVSIISILLIFTWPKKIYFITLLLLNAHITTLYLYKKTPP